MYLATNSTERRKHKRVEIEHAIFVEVVSGRRSSEGSNDLIKCKTVDISVEGLCIFVPIKIAVGSHLNIAVPAEGWIDNLELEGVARWIRDAKTGSGYWVGMELRDTSRENMAEWFKIVSRMRKKIRQEA